MVYGYIDTAGIKKMRPESELVLAIAKNIVYNQKDNVADLVKNGNINWLNFKDSLRYHSLGHFAYLSLKDYSSLLPQDLVKVLIKRLTTVFVCNII